MAPMPSQVGQCRGVRNRHKGVLVVVTRADRKGKILQAQAVVLSKNQIADTMLRYAQDGMQPTLGPVT